MENLISKYQKVPVEEHPNNIVEHPVVSVCVVTFNHVNHIKDNLEGILMQKTDFPFEILLGEDESNDGTREICKEYAVYKDKSVKDKWKFQLDPRIKDEIFSDLRGTELEIYLNN